MPFEDAKFIDELVDTNPLSNDPVNQGDDHIRSIKLALQANVSGSVTDTSLLVNELAALIMKRLTEFPIMSLTGETAGQKLAFGNVDGNDAIFLDNAIADAGIGLRGDDGATEMLEADPTKSVTLFFAGLPIFATEALGIDVRGGLDNDPATGGDQNTAITLQNASGVRNASLEYTSAGGTQLSLTNRILDGDISLRALGGSGTVAVFAGSPNGSAQLFFVGVAKLATTTDGWDSTGTIFDLGQQTDNSILMRLTNLIGGLRFINTSGAGVCQIQQLDNLNVFEKNWITMTRDAQVALSYDGSQKLQTGAGGVLVTGQLDIGDLAPVSISHATRKDYVDGKSSGDGAAKKIIVGDAMILSGVQTAIGTTAAVSYSTPFAAGPVAVNCTLSAGSGGGNNTVAVQVGSINSTTGFTALVGVSGATFQWSAMGRV